MGSAGGNDLAAFGGGHSATETRDAGVLFLGWLISLVCWHTIFLLAALWRMQLYVRFVVNTRKIARTYKQMRV